MFRLALAALLLSCACAPPAALRWPGRRAAGPASFKKFRVVTRRAVADVRHDLGMAEIARLHEGGKGFFSQKTQGLSLIKQSMATHTRFGTATGGGTVSAWFDDVIITVSIAPVVIHIPKEYPKGSCEYRAVLEHEEEHAQMALSSARLAAVELEKAVSAAEDMPTQERPLVFKSREEAGDFLKAKLSRAVGPVFDRFEAELGAAQAALDSPGAYETLYRRCAGWK